MTQRQFHAAFSEFAGTADIRRSLWGSHTAVNEVRLKAANCEEENFEEEKDVTLNSPSNAH